MLSPRVQFVLYLAPPAMKSGAAWLRAKDDNSTGVDDYGAEVLDLSARFLEDILTKPDEPSKAAKQLQTVIERYNKAVIANAKAKAVASKTKAPAKHK